MDRRFEIGDHVSWNSEAGRVAGTIIAVHTTDFNYKGHVHHASQDDPQYEIKSDKTEHIAAHKGRALEHTPEERRRVKLPFFTIGHSNRRLEEFIELLTGAHINLVADIRTVPRSRTNPQFNEDTLPDALVAFDISYEHMAALGGLR